MSLARQIKIDAPYYFWPLDEASGTTAFDASGNGRHATYNTATGVGAGVVLPGNRAWDGTYGRYISRAYDAGAAPGTGDFLLEWWFKGAPHLSGATNCFELIWNRDVGATGNGLDVYVAGANVVGSTVGAVRAWCGGTVAVGSKVITDGVLHHCWLQRVSGLLTLYVDDVVDSGINGLSRAASANGTGSPIVSVGMYEDPAGVPNQFQTGADRIYTENPIAALAWWVGTIPSSTRRTAHYQAGLRSGVMFG